jgi:alpha-galactosidase
MAAKSVMDDCVMGVHDEKTGDVFIIGSEAFGVMKQMEAYKDGKTVAIGLNNTKETIFEKVLCPGEVFVTPASFLLLSRDHNFQRIVDDEYARYVRKKLVLMRPENLPTAMYNTYAYQPQQTDLLPYDRNEILELIEMAADVGIDCFQVDAGWYDKMGDWNSNKDEICELSQFRGNFGEIADTVKEKGMKLGLWVSLAHVNAKSKVAIEHPEWIARDENGNPVIMFAPVKGHQWVVMCMDSGYKDFIIERIDRVVKGYGVDMLKVDLHAIRNPYISKFQHGCWASGHNHRTHGESYWGINEAILEACEAWQKRNPNCLIDLTYETTGVFDGIDLGMAKRLSMSWCVNDPNNEEGIRRVIYQRGRVVAPYFLNAWVIDTDIEELNEYTFLSNMGTYPIVIGNLKTMPMEAKEILKKWISWIKEQRKKSDFYGYYKVSDVFPVPDALEVTDYDSLIRGVKWMGQSPLPNVQPEGDRKGAVTLAPIDLKPEDHPGRVWDGFSRQDENGTGPVFFFRPLHSDEEQKTFKIPWVRGDWRYTIRKAPEMEIVGQFEGKELAEKGIQIEIKQRRNAAVLVFEKARV